MTTAYDRSDMTGNSRRSFMKAAVLGTGAAIGGVFNRQAHAAEPIKRPGEPLFKLSLAAYSFNRLLPRRGDDEAQANAEMTLADFVDYCAELDLDACEPTSYYFPKVIPHDYLMELKHQTFRLGLDISGTAIGNDFCLPEGEARNGQLKMTRDWIDYSATFGAPVIRIFAGRKPEGDSEDEAIRRCVEGINESLEYAAQKGVFLALENHGGITATPDQMLKIVTRVNPSPWFGVNFDSGNFRTDDPYGDLAKIAPYAINAQLKVSIYEKGEKKEADFKRIIGILREAGYRGYVALEYEEEADPRTEVPKYISKLREAIQA